VSQVTVRTKSELESARVQGIEKIIVEGSLANKLKNSKRIAYVGGGTIAVLTAAIAAAPFTGGVSFLAAAPIAALTGLEISAIIAVSAVGITLVIAVFKGYEEIEYSDGRLILRKKSA